MGSRVGQQFRLRHVYHRSRSCSMSLDRHHTPVVPVYSRRNVPRQVYAGAVALDDSNAPSGLEVEHLPAVGEALEQSPGTHGLQHAGAPAGGVLALAVVLVERDT